MANWYENGELVRESPMTDKQFDEWLEAVPEDSPMRMYLLQKHILAIAYDAFKAGQQLPSEPTEAMIEAWYSAVPNCYTMPESVLIVGWKAMLEAMD